jgi:hypothetical protein
VYHSCLFSFIYCMWLVYKRVAQALQIHKLKLHHVLHVMVDHVNRCNMQISKYHAYLTDRVRSIYSFVY